MQRSCNRLLTSTMEADSPTNPPLRSSSGAEMTTVPSCAPVAVIWLSERRKFSATMLIFPPLPMAALALITLLFKTTN